METMTKLYVEKESLLLQNGANTSVRILTKEIKYIIERNQNEKFLRNLLTRALILEELNQ